MALIKLVSQNQVDAVIGQLSSLSTDDKTSIVAAVNALKTDVSTVQSNIKGIDLTKYVKTTELSTKALLNTVETDIDMSGWHRQNMSDDDGNVYLDSGNTVLVHTDGNMATYAWTYRNGDYQIYNDTNSQIYVNSEYGSGSVTIPPHKLCRFTHVEDYNDEEESNDDYYADIYIGDPVAQSTVTINDMVRSINRKAANRGNVELAAADVGALACIVQKPIDTFSWTILNDSHRWGTNPGNYVAVDGSPAGYYLAGRGKFTIVNKSSDQIAVSHNSINSGRYFDVPVGKMVTVDSTTQKYQIADPVVDVILHAEDLAIASEVIANPKAKDAGQVLQYDGSEWKASSKPLPQSSYSKIVEAIGQAVVTSADYAITLRYIDAMGYYEPDDGDYYPSLSIPNNPERKMIVTVNKIGSVDSSSVVYPNIAVRFTAESLVDSPATVYFTNIGDKSVTLVCEFNGGWEDVPVRNITVQAGKTTKVTLGAVKQDDKYISVVGVDVNIDSASVFPMNITLVPDPAVTQYDINVKSATKVMIQAPDTTATKSWTAEIRAKLEEGGTLEFDFPHRWVSEEPQELVAGNTYLFVVRKYNDINDYLVNTQGIIDSI